MQMNKIANKSAGFSLVELMVGILIGLIATIVIINAFNNFERQKRTTTGNSDAQTNGAIGLFQIQHDAHSAGYGLPVYGEDQIAFNCPASTQMDTSVPADGVNDISLSPIIITDGGVGNDIIDIQYGDTQLGGIPVEMTVGSAANVARLPTNMGCRATQAGVYAGDIALTMQGTLTNPNCILSRVTAVSLAAALPVSLTLSNSTNVAQGSWVACLGNWQRIRYSIVANELNRAGIPVVSDIVNLQAQYGISTTGQSNDINAWVNATGAWAAPTAANRNRIKAIRVAITARNGLLERNNVTMAAPVAWADIAGSPAPAIVLNTNANWQRYRYRVYETTIPIRNMIYSRENAI
jgi:type IV pilus assembly protein PilW